MLGFADTANLNYKAIPGFYGMKKADGSGLLVGEVLGPMQTKFKDQKNVPWVSPSDVLPSARLTYTK